jgi:hypothetical protein
MTCLCELQIVNGDAASIKYPEGALFRTRVGTVSCPPLSRIGTGCHGTHVLKPDWI